MKKLILLLALFISLPCLADTYEVYYPSTLRIINTGFTNGTYCCKPRVIIDGLDGNKRVLYTGYTSGARPKEDTYSFTFIPSKNVKGKIVVKNK